MRDVSHDLDDSARKHLEIAPARGGHNQHLRSTAIEFGIGYEMVKALEIDAGVETTLAHAVHDADVHGVTVVGMT